MMNFKHAINYTLTAALALCAMGAAASTAAGQEKPEAKTGNQRSAGRDPFKRYQPVVKTKSTTKLEPPTIQERIERYRTQKMAASAAHVAAPKPTTALLLSELQVTGIFRTPRGWSAMVEATPLTPKLSYVIYPGETFFDGQLVAIEESRLVFRRDVVWADGRHEKSVEIKPLRAPTTVEAMTAAKTSAADAQPTEAAKSATPEKQ
jgi:hypothetical protein